MLIRCPDCEFEREMNTATIPPTATLATCPRCGTKFRFRDPETGEPVFRLQDAAQTPLPGPAAPPRLPTEKEGDDPLPPGAIIPTLNTSDLLPPASDSPEAPSTTRTPSNITPDLPGDIPKKERSGTDSKPAPPPVEPASGGLLGSLKAIFEEKNPERDPQPAPRPSSPPRAPEDSEPLQPAEPQSPKLPPLETERSVPYPEEERKGIPWENPEGYGFFGSFMQTVLQVMFKPGLFFSQVTYGPSLLKPALFYAVTNVLYFMISILTGDWLQLQDSLAGSASPEMQEILRSSFNNVSMPLIFLLLPFVALFTLFITSVFFHIMLLLAQPDRANYNIMVRVLAYSSAPLILSIVPVLGALVAYVWSWVATFIGCKYAFRLSWGKTTLALVPIYLLGVAMSIRMMQSLLSGF